MLSYVVHHRSFLLFVITISTFIFWVIPQLHRDVPNLKDVTTVVMKVFALSEFPRETYPVEDIFEGLLAHFFSKHQSSYNLEDIRWFLQIANRQFQWQAKYLMNEVIDAEYFDDMLAKVEFSLDPSIEPPLNCWVDWVSMPTFKFYLLRVLHNYACTVEDSTDSVMLFFKKNEVCFYIHICMYVNSTV